MKDRLVSLIVIIPAVMLFGCGGPNSLCVDGTNNHDYIFHEKEIFEDKEGHDDYYECSKCHKYFSSTKEYLSKIPSLDRAKIVIVEKYNGKKINTNDGTVTNYLEAKGETKQAEFLYTNRGSTACTTKGISFMWENNGGSNSYSIEFSKDNSFSDIEKTITGITGTNMTIYNLDPGVHYYHIKDTSSNYSIVDSFEVTNQVKTIKSNGVKNIRDVGGWQTISNDKVKYGYLYRSALPSSSDTDLLYGELGIKTEMDLRIKGGINDEIKNFTGINGDLISYVHPVPDNAQFWPQYDQIFQPQYKDAVKEYFSNVFTVLSSEENYPVLFHCKSGADRTGTLAYFINGLAGVNFENLTKDFELTSFFISSRWRSAINLNDSTYSFDPSGKMGTTASWNYFHNIMLNDYGNGRTLPETLLNFLTGYCEVDKDLIKKTLSIIVDGNDYMNLFK